MLKYAPRTVIQIIEGKPYNLPVLSYVSYPPNTHPTCPLRKDCYALELKTKYGSVWQGFERSPMINSELRMVIDITGREHDQVLMALPDCLTK